MRIIDLFAGVLAFPFLAEASSAYAQTPSPAGVFSSIELKAIGDARLRYEQVEQEAVDAEAGTLRVRAGAEARVGRFSLLAEAEATVAAMNEYNAFPFQLAGSRQRRPEHATVADPENLELNRLQLQFEARDGVVTLGRQRINLDDQRWVGSVGWRQNEQTFDAARAESSVGPFGVDLALAVNQRTIWGTGAGARTALKGEFVLAAISSERGPIRAKLFAYLLDYDETFFFTNSSQTYGGILSVPLASGGHQIALRASYARQSNYRKNPFEYSADYWSVEGGTKLAGFDFTAGWEKLGSSNGRSVQTPMATLHKFNGWADMFLTTPPAGLQDAWVSVGRKFERAKALPGLNASVAFHQFDSARGGIEYGTEWDASAGFTLRSVGVLLKYADYDAKGFGIDTRKLWLQVEWKF
jgi:hypothetical protein